jgi:hypothetical protein
MNINFGNFKVRCSAIGKILTTSKENPCLTEKQAIRLDELQAKPTITEKQQAELAELLVKKENSTKVILSDTCIEYLMEAYALFVYGKKSVTKELDIEYYEKGKLMEEESITLLSLVEKMYYEKNDERVENEFLSGEPDLFVGAHIMKAERITDIKSVWDYPGFLKRTVKGLDAHHDEQVKGYMDITGAKQGEVAYCLVNMPDTIQNDYRRKLMYRMNVATEEAPEFLRAAAELTNSMVFDNIPMNLRVYKVVVPPFNDFERSRVYERVKHCREWLNAYHIEYQKLNAA